MPYGELIEQLKRIARKTFQNLREQFYNLLGRFLEKLGKKI